MSQHVTPFCFPCPCSPSPPTLGPSMSPIASPTNHQATPSFEPLPQALKGPYAQPVLRQGAPPARTSPPCPPELSAWQWAWAKKDRNHRKASSPPPTTCAHCKLASSLPVCALSEAFRSSPLLLEASPDPSLASGLQYVWS